MQKGVRIKFPNQNIQKEILLRTDNTSRPTIVSLLDKQLAILYIP